MIVRAHAAAKFLQCTMTIQAHLFDEVHSQTCTYSTHTYTQPTRTCNSWLPAVFYTLTSVPFLVKCTHKHARTARTRTCNSWPSAVFHTRTSVPFSEALANRLPSRDRVMQQRELLCAEMKRVCRRSYNSTRICMRARVRACVCMRVCVCVRVCMCAEMKRVCCRSYNSTRIYMHVCVLVCV